MADFNSALPVRSTDLDIRDLLFATDKVDVSGSTGLGVTATNLDIRDLVFATDKVDVSGSTITTSFSDALATGPVQFYQTSAALAASASVNLDYTVTAAKTLLLKQILATASGKIKVVIKTGPLASLVTHAVDFNSTADPQADTTFAQPIEVPDTSTGTVRVTITNLEASAMDVYATVIGNEI